MFGNSTAALSHVHKLKCRKSNSHKASKHSNARLKVPAKLKDRGGVGPKKGGRRKKEKKGKESRAILEHCLNRKTQKLARRCMLNYVHTFVGSTGRTQKTSDPDGGLRNTDYKLRTTGSPYGWAWSWAWAWEVCMCGFYTGQPLNLLSVYAASVLVRFSSEIYYILITPRGLVVAVKAYFLTFFSFLASEILTKLPPPWSLL